MAAMAVFNEETGSLAEGKLADLTIMKYTGAPHMSPGHNPVSDLIYAGNSRDVEMVMVDGRIVLEEGRCCLLDEERILYEATARSQRIACKP
jgi:5-methylthioadenosine/S-adenosylhomocysteine deaminase